VAFLSRHRKILLIELVLIIAVFFIAKAYSQRHLVKGIAPPILATTISGQQIELANYKGKPLLLHFWASWCPVCELEQDSINAISKDFPVISIAMNSGGEREIKKYMSEQQLDFPTVVDEQAQIARQFGVRGVPTSFIINPDGQIESSEIGYTSETGLRFRLWLANN
jgi:thiol-disulfide isomerase/thioredoxin